MGPVDSSSSITRVDCFGRIRLMKLLITYNDLHNRIFADTQELFQSYKPSHSLKSLFLYQFSPAEKQVKYVSVFLLACASYGLQ